MCLRAEGAQLLVSWLSLACQGDGWLFHLPLCKYPPWAAQWQLSPTGMLQTLERWFYKPGEMDGWGKAGFSIGSLESQVCWVQKNNHSTRTSQMPWQLESGGYCIPGMHALTKDSFPSCGLQAESSSLVGIFIGLLSYVGLDV